MVQVQAEVRAYRGQYPQYASCVLGKGLRGHASSLRDKRSQGSLNSEVKCLSTLSNSSFIWQNEQLQRFVLRFEAQGRGLDRVPRRPLRHSAACVCSVEPAPLSEHGTTNLGMKRVGCRTLNTRSFEPSRAQMSDIVEQLREIMICTSLFARPCPGRIEFGRGRRRGGMRLQQMLFD